MSRDASDRIALAVIGGAEMRSRILSVDRVGGSGWWMLACAAFMRVLGMLERATDRFLTESWCRREIFFATPASFSDKKAAAAYSVVKRHST